MHQWCISSLSCMSIFWGIPVDCSRSHRAGLVRVGQICQMSQMLTSDMLYRSTWAACVLAWFWGTRLSVRMRSAVDLPGVKPLSCCLLCFTISGNSLYCQVTLNENSNNDMFDNFDYYEQRYSKIIYFAYCVVYVVVNSTFIQKRILFLTQSHWFRITKS